MPMSCLWFRRNEDLTNKGRHQGREIIQYLNEVHSGRTLLVIPPPEVCFIKVAAASSCTSHPRRPLTLKTLKSTWTCDRAKFVSG